MVFATKKVDPVSLTFRLPQSGTWITNSVRDAGPVGGSGAEVVTSEQRFAGKYIHIHIVFRPIFSIPILPPSPTRCLPVFLPVLTPSETSSPNAFPQLLALARHIPTGQQPSSPVSHQQYVFVSITHGLLTSFFTLKGIAVAYQSWNPIRADELSNARAPGVSTVQPSGQKLVSFEEVQKHNKREDCWVIIDVRKQ